MSVSEQPPNPPPRTPSDTHHLPKPRLRRHLPLQVPHLSHHHDDDLHALHPNRRDLRPHGGKHVILRLSNDPKCMRNTSSPLRPAKFHQPPRHRAATTRLPILHAVLPARSPRGCPLELRPHPYSPQLLCTCFALHRRDPTCWVRQRQR